MSFGQPSSFGVLNSSQTAPNTAFSRSNSIAQGATNTAFSRSSSIAAPHGPAEVVMGDEVPESESDAIGYVGLAGELKVKVFDGQYPESDLPIPSSQLLSVSQKRQLFAAGGPQGVVVARTSTLRASFKNVSSANGKTIPFQPECVIPMSLRLSHIAFTADGTYLLLAAQLGGIAVYLVDEILSKGNDVQPHSQIVIGPLLEMKPIPTTTEAEKVCVLVGSGWGQGGNVGILDVKTSQVQENLKSGVTTVCWSPKGKQIICGGSGGGFAWIKPDGKQDDAVEGVPNYPNYFVSSIFWIEAATIFVVLTPKPQLGQPHDNESIHFVLMRELHTRKHTFYKVNDTTPPFGMTSRPTYHSFIHLKAWGPTLKDCLILSNTCSTDIGTVLRLTNTPFTPTMILSDGRRATLPLTADGGDTTPIGLSLDLTATDAERVSNPFPNVEQSATSLPCMWVLTNEGVISAYWVVHSDAIKVGNSTGAYPELVAYESQQPPQTPQRTSGPAFGQAGFGQSQTSTFGTPKSTFGQPSTPTSNFGQPSKPLAFGQTSAPVSTFGQASQPASAFVQASTGTSAFGQQSQPNSAFGQSSQPASTFGQPSQPTSTFGQSSAPQPVFGQSSAPQSAFGQSAGAFGQTAPKPTFGQPAFGSTSALGRPGMPSGAFGSSTGSAFGGGPAFGAQQGASAFGQKPAAPAFGATTALGSTAPAFGSTTALGQARPAFGQSAFGSSGAGTGFGQTSQLGSKLSAFGSTTAASTGGFAKFSGGGGFGSGNATTTASPAFLQQSGSNNPFASKEPNTFGTLKNGAAVSAFGSGGQGNFAISSAFGSTATADNGKPSGSGSGTGAFGAFGNSLGSALSQPAASINIKDDEMADSDDEVEQPKAGVRGGNMFSLSAVNNTTTTANETPKTLAPAFGQPSQLSAGPSKPSAFGSGIFGSTLNKEPKGAFGSQNKPAALAPAFGTSESKPNAPVSAFGPKSPETPSDKVGTGLFGSALQRTNSGAQPASAFGTAGSSSSKPTPVFGTTTTPVTSAFSKSVAPTSAFATGPSSPSKPIVSAFGQKSTPVVSSPEKTPVPSEVGAAASKVLPSDDSDEDTDHSPEEVEAAPLPPDFAPTVKRSEPTLSEDAPLPPDFASIKAGPLKTPLPESAPRTPALAPTLPKPMEQSKPAETPVEKSAEKHDKTNDKTPPKSSLFGLPPSAQSQASALKPSKAANPMSNRRGSKLTTSNVLKPTLSGRTPSQKAGATTKGTKLASKDHDDKDDPGSPKLESFFPGAGAKVVGPQKNGESVLTLGKPTKAIDTGFSFGDSKIDEISDSSEEEEEDDVSDAGNENNGLESGEDSDQPAGSEDGSWVEDGDTEDEDSPTQQSIPPKNIKNPPRRDLGSLFSHASPPPTDRTVKRIPVTTTKAAYIPKTANKPPIKLPEPSKVTPNSLAAILSPTSTKTEKQDVPDRRELKNNLNTFDTDKDKRERELLEARDRILREQEELVAAKKLEIARIQELNDKEEEIKRREIDYREKLALPPDPSPTLNPLIPYHEQAFVTNFEGQDGALENAVITLERRIDNFGENVKNLKAFVIYHRESDHFTLDDPRPVEELRVTAAPDISLMAKDLMEKFHELEKALDLAAFRAGITPLIRDIDYLVARASDIPNMLLIHNHPELRAYLRKRPLSSQQRMRQAYLRRKLPIMRRRFKRAEGMYRVLQARIACMNKHNGTNIGDLAPPTIEHLRESAVYLADSMRERAQRVDELEGALRKMRLSGGSPAMSRGTTPSFRASSIGFSTSGRDFDRSGAPGWLKSTRKSKGPLFALPTKATPGPDSLDYYESTIDNPISRYQYGKQPKSKPKTISGPGTFGLTEEELGEDEYFNGKDPSFSNGFPIATSYDRIMAGMRKEILITPKKGDTSREIPETPASRRVSKFVGVQVAMMTGGRARKTWINETDYLEDRKLKKEIGGRLSKLIKKVGVKTTKVELA